ncbi:polyprenyl synthetase family protein [Kribbella sindirgiensis]|uniref:Polyprenyl synthetase family protein n=1 Tax=Kribbella sindirgiensis TaxID=1124744 RepID=A0A4R0IPP0_9ACTN|nr:polyprenyl synthetase family protein [Kribbella sindirgiensis]TCC34927.1 polyprenyl synthetase family protein [Kribbella sindirgiensis]
MTAVQMGSAPDILIWSRRQIDGDLRRAIESLPIATRRVAAYHLGWEDEDGRPAHLDGGKAIRPALVLLAAQAVGGISEVAVSAAVAVELIHNFSLLHDDVMDCDLTRRHRATAWTVFGLGPAIMAGDALLGLALDVLLATGHPRGGDAARMLGADVQNLIEGQMADADMERRDHVDSAECLRMAQLKTGTLLGASTALGALLGGGDPRQIEHLRRYGENLGLAYQYVDDILGIWGASDVTGKPVSSDLRRRKKSLPVVAALNSGTSAGRKLAVLYRREVDPTDADLVEMAELIEQAGGRRDSQTRANALLTASLEELTASGIPAAEATGLERLARLVTSRQH